MIILSSTITFVQIWPSAKILKISIAEKIILSCDDEKEFHPDPQATGEKTFFS